MVADNEYGQTTVGLSPQVRVALAICRAWLAYKEYEGG